MNSMRRGALVPVAPVFRMPVMQPKLAVGLMVRFAALYTKPTYKDRVKREYVSYMESIVSFFEQRSIEVAGRRFLRSY